MSAGGWTSEDMWSSFRAAKEKEDFWYGRARGHLDRKKPCEDCDREKEMYGVLGCGIWADSYEKAEKWRRDANYSKTQAQRKEREEGKPETVDGTKTVAQAREEYEEMLRQRWADEDAAEST